MGTVCKEIQVQRPASEVWDAVRDYGAVHRRVAPGFVIDAQLEGSDRVITFASGTIAREFLVSLDDERMRFVYKVVDARLPFEHHQGRLK